MRALCGAIITAGAMIGLGLTAIGFGIRYQGMADKLNPKTDHVWGAASMTYLFAIIFAGLLIGLGIAFVGLMFHHERRHREHLRELGHSTTAVGPQV
jgi:hypothetical protein